MSRHCLYRTKNRPAYVLISQVFIQMDDLMTVSTFEKLTMFQTTKEKLGYVFFFSHQRSVISLEVYNSKYDEENCSFQ